MHKVINTKRLITHPRPTGKDDTSMLSERSANSKESGSTDAKKKPGTGPLNEFVLKSMRVILVASDPTGLDMLELIID